MATLVLSAAGAAIGGTFGGTVLGLSGAVIGKAIGATIGAAIDQRLLGTGSSTVSVGRLEALRVQGASEGAVVPRIFGRVRVAGNIIWSSRFLETKKQTGGGKGNPQRVVSYSYSVSLAVALCEGEVTRIGRVWADGNEISLNGINWRLHAGTEDQLPDPLIDAVEGAGEAPAYRGVAYLVFEDLDLSPFGNRVPQFNVEVVRKVRAPEKDGIADPYEAIRAVALVPGSGEYTLATKPVRFELGKGQSRVANVNTASGQADIIASLDQLNHELPQVDSVSMVVSWFGDDLRCGTCTVSPRVEQTATDPSAMPWKVNGVGRSSAQTVSVIDGRPAFGGTPADGSVIEAIQHIKSSGKSVMFYPFVMMDVAAGNNLFDPWTGAAAQPVYPWRGRITLDVAPGLAGTVDQTAAAAAQVDAFFGAAAVSDFSISGGEVQYSGPAEWSYRRFILHYAHLCVASGGVEAFVIGSEMRGLTTIRTAAAVFPSVAHLQALAADVRSVVGPATKITYAADWSEYFGYHPADGSGDVFFHLDPLWADTNIDCVGIDNYMPLSDWRDDVAHLDQSFRSIYNLDYLKGNVAGGEGFDWFYLNQADRDAQIRSPITDGAYADHWVFRYKDLKAWWSNQHHNRPGGVRAAASTEWVPSSKPIWFTEFGCAAIDKGTNQPNVFFDPKSSESFAPYFSTENRDDFIQYRFLQAHYQHWADVQNNPVSAVYGGPMVDTSNMYVWAWDARPWPDFPNRIDVWSDGENYGSGHWLSGRAGMAPLAGVVEELSARANFADYDVRELHGAVEGYVVSDVESARQSMEPLMLSHGFDGFELGSECVFRSRFGLSDLSLVKDQLVEGVDTSPLTLERDALSTTASNVQIQFYNGRNDYQLGTVSVGFAAAEEPTVAASDLPVVLSHSEGLRVADRWLVESEVARETASFVLPMSKLGVSVGDVVDFSINGSTLVYRIDKIEDANRRICEATRIEPGAYQNGRRPDEPLVPKVFALPQPVHVEFLDLPLLGPDDVAHAPLVAASGVPWIGPASVYSAPFDSGYALNTQINTASVVGTLTSDLPAREPDLWSRGTPVRVDVPSGELLSKIKSDVLNGANLAAIRNQGSADWEIVQFCEAALVGLGQYEIDGFLRGQFGTSAYIPPVQMAGADFVLLDGSAAQVNLSMAERGLERNYRIGPSSRGYDDDSYLHVTETFDGIGLRPYPVAHLSARQTETGDVHVKWTRQTREGGDSWAGADVPLSEDSEAYLVRFFSGGTLLREVPVSLPETTYTNAEWVADGSPASFDVDVAQVSVQFGPGPFRRMTFNG